MKFKRCTKGQQDTYGYPVLHMSDDGRYLIAKHPTSKTLLRGGHMLEHGVTLAKAAKIAVFVDALEDIVKSMPKATPQEEPCRWTAQTIAGLLHITIYGDWVALRFEDVEKARKVVGQRFGYLNEYSGKWNFHAFKSNLDEYIIEQFKWKMAAVTSE